MPATWAAADLPEAAELVYIAAFVLAPGTSMLDWMGGEFPPDWIRSDDGLAVKAADPEQLIFSGVDAALTAEAVSRLNWQGLRAFTEPLRSTPTETPATYIVATEDRALPPGGAECVGRPRPAPDTHPRGPLAAPVSSRRSGEHHRRRCSALPCGCLT